MSRSTEAEAQRRVNERYRLLGERKQFSQGEAINSVFSVPEKTLWLINSVDAVLGNCPFQEFFTRPVSAYLEEITNAFLRVGAHRCAEQFTKATAIFAPDPELERDAEFVEIGKARARRAENLSESDIKQLDACYETFFDCAESEELMTKLDQYLQATI